MQYKDLTKNFMFKDIEHRDLDARKWFYETVKNPENQKKTMNPQTKGEIQTPDWAKIRTLYAAKYYPELLMKKKTPVKSQKPLTLDERLEKLIK